MRSIERSFRERFLRTILSRASSIALRTVVPVAWAKAA